MIEFALMIVIGVVGGLIVALMERWQKRGDKAS
jgi:type II secretory pathway pseudopilin PulG